jgi:L-ascorbate metabolism protein UlaG (beta-lactamase superfamily)
MHRPFRQRIFHCLLVAPWEANAGERWDSPIRDWLRLKLDSNEESALLSGLYAPMPKLRFIKQMIFDGRGPPLPTTARPEPVGWSDDGITGSCLGHSTVLLNLFGVRVLTDPVFSKRVGLGIPPFVLGPKRHFAPALAIKDFKAPDVILLSHAHFDHFDVWSLRQFHRQTPIITARATSDLLRFHGFKNIHELDWGECFTLRGTTGTLRITGLEVAHWGARMMRDEHRGYNGYLLEMRDHRICFAGDTAFTHTFSQLYDPAHPIDLMLMPIGAYDPWIRAHCSPEQAVEMAREAGARCFVPIHHETFKLSSEPMEEPAARLRAALVDAPPRLLAVRVGETFRVPLRDVTATQESV